MLVYLIYPDDDERSVEVFSNHKAASKAFNRYLKDGYSPAFVTNNLSEIIKKQHTEIAELKDTIRTIINWYVSYQDNIKHVPLNKDMTAFLYNILSICDSWMVDALLGNQGEY